jgi:PIN domain nuclease of toxin-antitoxin system
MLRWRSVPSRRASRTCGNSSPKRAALAIRTAHIRALAGLPHLHKDPFDRILIAQALAESLTLASKDSALARYGVPVVW